MKTAAKRAARRSPMEHPRHQYPAETAALQQLAQGCGLTEQIKWGKPCFLLGERNIVLIQRFNRYIALLFFKGALLHDSAKLLHRIGEHTEMPRQLRFTSADEIERLRSTITVYIQEAIRVETSGAKQAGAAGTRTVPAELLVPEELQQRLERDPAFCKAFTALTPGRRKGYILQIAGAKQSATRTARIEKFAPRILAGKGLHN